MLAVVHSTASEDSFEGASSDIEGSSERNGLMDKAFPAAYGDGREEWLEGKEDWACIDW